MRDQRSPHALPRAPNEEAHEAGLRAVPTPLERLKAQRVRCPHCDKLLAEHLTGTFTTVCVRCKKRVTATR